MNKFLKLSGQVQAALAADKPIVALESTVIAHGLPRPQNLQTGQKLEQIVRDHGAEPATIAVLGGELRVGLSSSDLELLANSDDIRKVSVRDLAIAAAQKWNGATTVASTMWIAHRAGIQVFATGGIGGVHRGSLPDISADLPQLAGTPMIVVCSGAKMVLDLPATREWLETHSVTVVGYQCDELPAFYSRRSGLPVDAQCDSPEQVVQIFRAQRELNLSSALLVTTPVPADAEVDASILNDVLDHALAQANQQSISGRNITPFLLARMAEASEGATLTANVALLENNARLAARVASTLKDMTS